jgi:hypothetical protein
MIQIKNIEINLIWSFTEGTVNTDQSFSFNLLIFNVDAAVSADFVAT